MKKQKPKIKITENGVNPKFCSYQKTKARKIHICTECNSVIFEKDTYHYFAGRWNYDFKILKLCKTCYSCIKLLDIYNIGELDDNLKLLLEFNDGIFLEDEFGKLEIGAKKKILKMLGDSL